MRHFITKAALGLLTCVSLFAQANRGSITGTVQDQSGALVPSVPIEVRNLETRELFSAGASGTGNYVVPVPIGNYELSVSSPGFKKFVLTGVPVIEGQATRRDVTLELGQLAEVTTVTDIAPLLKTESGDVSYRVTTDLANEVPVLTLSGTGGALGNIRNPLSMTALLPGVQFSTTGFPTLTINGLPSNSQTWMIEGQDATPTLWRGVTSDRGQGGVDSIQAMTVQTSNFAAEFGKAGGAAINYTMKSGTNQFHGSVYDYFVNEFLNAGTPNTDWIDQSSAANNRRFDYKSGQHVRDRKRQNDYGFTLGGPIRIPKIYNGKDKTWFFFSLEQFRETQVVNAGLATVPTVAYRNGDFRNSGCTNFDPASNTCVGGRQPITLNGQPAVDAAGTAILSGGVYNPATYRIVNGSPVRDLFADQQIPISQFDKVALNIQNLFPLPTNNNLINNYNIPAYQNYRRTLIPSIKIDHVLTPNIRLSGYWGINIRDQNNANGFLAEQYPWTGSQSTPYRNDTIRINFDQTIGPTRILHIGIGYFHQIEPNVAPVFDQSRLGWPGAGAPNAFPNPNAFPTFGAPVLGGTLSNNAWGGFNPAFGVSFDATAWEEKPTANLNLTWVKGNHTYKFGGDMTIQGYITRNRWRANGNFTFDSAQTGDPWESGQALNVTNPTGFIYASFLLGAPSVLALAQPTFTRLGGHAFAFFAQDSWKVTHKLTIEYGLRYDYQTYLREQYGRHASASFSTFNPTVGLNGAIAYEATCKCNLSSNYPFAFGPRFNAAYQITPKTVFRAGFGVNYNVVQTPAGNNFSVGDFYTINAPGYGLSAMPQGFAAGNTFYKGNPYGNTEVVWPVFDPGRLPPRNAGLLPPTSPFSLYHPDSRPGRIVQWSAGIQREIARDLVVELSYVGNRGMWFYSPLLDVQALNSLAGGQLALFGLDITNANDRALLSQNIASGGVINPAAAARGITRPYIGFPDNQQVGQAIRPVPQWGTVNPYLGPNRGNTWYDSLQLQGTRRYSHGLSLNGNFTYAHATVLGVSSDTDFFLAGRPQVMDPYNRQINKQLNQNVPPLKTVITGTYTTPALPGATNGFRHWASTAVKDWQVGAVLQYQSGQLLTVPASNNGLVTLLRLNTLPGGGSALNPWNYSSGASFWNKGFDPNGSFDPRSYTTSNPAASSVLAGGFSANGTCAVANCAWTDVPAGQWGSTAPYLEGFRWRRRPSEALNFGRNFRMGREGHYNLFLRAEFQNVLNRMFYNAPSTTNPSGAVTTTTQRGIAIPTGGYGVVNTLNGLGSSPRSGQIVARFTF